MTRSLKFQILACLVLSCWGVFCTRKVNKNQAGTAKPLNVLVLTGGHGYDTLDFQRMFDQMPGLRMEHALLERNAAFFDDISDWNHNVLVFYNFRNKLSEAGKENFLRLCDQGVGMVFLHHSLMGFDDWPEFKNIVGAKYFFEGEAPEDKLGNYKHDVTVNIRIARADHPITKGMSDFQLFDEVYGNYWVSEENALLMTTDHPDSQPEIGWTRRYRRSQVAFIQPGHGKEALRDKNYAEMVRRAILWAGGAL